MLSYFLCFSLVKIKLLKSLVVVQLLQIIKMAYFLDWLDQDSQLMVLLNVAEA